MLQNKHLFYIDPLSIIMITLVAFVSLCIASFSSRYLKGDRKQSSFYLNLVCLVGSLFIMVCSNHILLFLTSWASSNYFLTQLMLHKHEWKAARESSTLAIKNYALGLIFLISAISILYMLTGDDSIQEILRKPIKPVWSLIIGFLLLFAAMTQSALLPFHRWLVSSLNSPTPVSAIMHAGLVNGGGFLLARFAPILLKTPTLLNIVFTIGIITAFVGTLWKLMQSDVKRMLACSTVGQMGFMMAQCGLGLFSAAIAHLCWHGLFKAYLFLSSGSLSQEKRLDLEYPPSLKDFFLALICGLFGGFLFSLTTGKEFFSRDTSLFLTVIAIVAGTQLALTIIRGNSIKKLPLGLFMNVVMGAFYGLSVHFIEIFIEPLGIDKKIPINALHILALFLMIGSWIAILFGRFRHTIKYPDWILKIYVLMLNLSQPDPKTVTAHRNGYQF